jgi:hypothetical protein
MSPAKPYCLYTEQVRAYAYRGVVFHLASDPDGHRTLRFLGNSWELGKMTLSQAVDQCQAQLDTYARAIEAPAEAGAA